MIIRDPRAGGQRHARHDRRALHRDRRHHADHPRLARPADPAPVRRPLAAAASARASRRPTGAPRCTTSSTSATSTTASPNRRSACRWTSARLAVVQDENFKYVHFAALPPLFFDLKKDPGQFVNRADRSGLCRPKLAEYAAQDARLAPGLRRPHADRLPRHAERAGGARGVVFAGSARTPWRGLSAQPRSARYDRMTRAHDARGPNMKCCTFATECVGYSVTLAARNRERDRRWSQPAPLEIHSAVTMSPCGRVDMAFNRTPAWLTLAATIFVAAHASALETLPGEPPVEDRQQAIQERVSAVRRAPGERPRRRRRSCGGAASRWSTVRSRSSSSKAARASSMSSDPASLKGLGPGDKVRFEVERDGRSYTITRLVNSN